MKKAYLVTFSIRTRVIADTDKESGDDIIEKAVDKILDHPSEYVRHDNLDEMCVDKNIPYDPNGIDEER